MASLTDLALSARGGDRLALGAFIRQTQADVWRACARLGPKGMAEDLTQEVYIRMMRALPSFRGESSAKTWLLAIARHTSIDAMRSHQCRERLNVLLARSKSVEDADCSFDVASLISALNHQQREAFVLTQLLGLSYGEAAEVCECPIGTIRSRVARARSRLADAITVVDLDEYREPAPLEA